MMRTTPIPAAITWATGDSSDEQRRQIVQRQHAPRTVRRLLHRHRVDARVRFTTLDTQSLRLRRAAARRVHRIHARHRAVRQRVETDVRPKYSTNTGASGVPTDV